MEIVPFLWAIGLVIPPTAVSGAIGVLGMNPARYNDAKILFCAAGASIFGVALLFGLTVSISTPFRILGTAAIGAFAAVLAVESVRWITKIEQNALRQPQNVGRLEASEVLFSVKQPGRLFEIGDSGAKFRFEGPEGVPLFKFFANSELLVESVDGALKVSTKFIDRAGALIAELNRNEWKVALPPKTWDRNYTRDALEVINAEGSVALQIKVLPDRIQLQGEWWGPDNRGVRFVKCNDPQTGKTVGCWAHPENPNAPQIERMFVYPSELHLGELRK